MSYMEQIITAIYRFQRYPKLISQRFGRVILYLLFFTLFVTIINSIPFCVAYKNMGGITGIIETYVPDFSITNGKFKCESVDYSDDVMGVKIFIDDNENAENVNTDNYIYYLVADSDKMIISNGMQKTVIEFNQFENENFTKDGLIKLFSSKKVKAAIFAILLIMTAFSLCIKTVMGLFMISILASIINICFVKANINYLETLKLSVYARTFPTILLIVINMLGFAGGIFIYWGLLITYIYLGLRNIKKQEVIILAEL